MSPFTHHLLELKPLRADMPQVNTDDLPIAMQKLAAMGLPLTQDRVPASEIKKTQHDMIPAKVDAVAKGLRAMADTSTMKPIILSADNHVIDGHHRVAAFIEVEGPDALVPSLRLNLPRDEALKVFQDVADSIGECMHTAMELWGLASLNGTFTESRLSARGFRVETIRKARRLGLFTENHVGNLSTCPLHLREAKVLCEIGPAIAAAARVAGPAIARTMGAMNPGTMVKQIVKGIEKNFQIVKDDAGKLIGIDPENPDEGPVDLNKDEVAAVDPEGEEETDDTNSSFL